MILCIKACMLQQCLRCKDLCLLCKRPVSQASGLQPKTQEEGLVQWLEIYWSVGEMSEQCSPRIFRAPEHNDNRQALHDVCACCLWLIKPGLKLRRLRLRHCCGSGMHCVERSAPDQALCSPRGRTWESLCCRSGTARTAGRSDAPGGTCRWVALEVSCGMTLPRVCVGPHALPHSNMLREA